MLTDMDTQQRKQHSAHEIRQMFLAGRNPTDIFSELVALAPEDSLSAEAAVVEIRDAFLLEDGMASPLRRYACREVVRDYADAEVIRDIIINSWKWRRLEPRDPVEKTRIVRSEYPEKLRKMYLAGGKLHELVNRALIERMVEPLHQQSVTELFESTFDLPLGYSSMVRDYITREYDDLEEHDRVGGILIERQRINWDVTAAVTPVQDVSVEDINALREIFVRSGTLIDLFDYIRGKATIVPLKSEYVDDVFSVAFFLENYFEVVTPGSFLMHYLEYGTISAMDSENLLAAMEEKRPFWQGNALKVYISLLTGDAVRELRAIYEKERSLDVVLQRVVDCEYVAPKNLALLARALMQSLRIGRRAALNAAYAFLNDGDAASRAETYKNLSLYERIDERRKYWDS